MQYYFELARHTEKKYPRSNQSSFINKTFSKERMQRSKLRNIFLKPMVILIRKNYVIKRRFGL